MASSRKTGVQKTYKYSSELLLASLSNSPMYRQLRLVSDLGGKISHPIMGNSRTPPRPSIRVPNRATVTFPKRPVRQVCKASTPNTELIPRVVVTAPDGAVEIPEIPSTWPKVKETRESRQQRKDWKKGTFLSPIYPVYAQAERKERLKKEKRLRCYSGILKVRPARIERQEAKREATLG